MGNGSSSKRKLQITDVDRAVLALKTQRRRLQDHCTRVTAQVNREQTVARQLIASGHKDRAMLALKKKRLQETTLTKLDAYLLNVETMLADVELSKDQVRVMAALKQGNEAQKQLQQAVALEDVEKLMEDTAEAQEYQDQLRVLLGESWTGEDEAATEEEFAALEQEMTAEMIEKMPKVPGQVVKEEEVVVLLPSAPTHAPVPLPSASSRKEEEVETRIAAS